VAPFAVSIVHLLCDIFGPFFFFVILGVTVVIITYGDWFDRFIVVSHSCDFAELWFIDDFIFVFGCFFYFIFYFVFVVVFGFVFGFVGICIVYVIHSCDGWVVETFLVAIVSFEWICIFVVGVVCIVIVGILVLVIGIIIVFGVVIFSDGPAIVPCEQEFLVGVTASCQHVDAVHDALWHW
jgi:hypothetical protein